MNNNSFNMAKQNKRGLKKPPTKTNWKNVGLDILNRISWVTSKEGREYGEADALNELGKGPKYLTGSRVNYMDDPSSVLMEDWRNKAKADLAGERSFGAQASQMLGPVVSQGIQSLGMSGYKKGVQSEFDSNQFKVDQTSWLDKIEQDPYDNFNALGTLMAATGGNIPQKNVEVEGQEMFELPSGEVGKFSGPSHENGGVNVDLPVGTGIYSKRLKGPDGKTMARRKEERVQKENMMKKNLEKNPMDKLAKSTADRIAKALQLEEESDMAIMQQAFNEQNGVQEQQEFATGGPVLPGLLGTELGGMMLGEHMVNGVAPEDFFSMLGSEPITGISNLQEAVVSSKARPKNPYQRQAEPTLPQQAAPTTSNKGFGMTAGDWLGTAGNFLKAGQAYKDTLGEISGSIPNVNSMQNFGQNALGTLQGNQAMLQQMYDLQTRALRSRSSAATAQTRGTARGVNTMRAGDIANTQAQNQGQMQIDAANTQAMLANNNAIAQQQNAMDQATMSGDAAMRLANQQDYAQDRMNMQQGRQSMIDAATTQTAGVLNNAQLRKTMAGLLSARYDNFEVDAFGNVSAKPGELNLTTDQKIAKAGLWDTYQSAKETGADVEFKNGNLYVKNTNTLYAPGNGKGKDAHEDRDYETLLETGGDYLEELGDDGLASLLKPKFQEPTYFSGVTSGKAVPLVQAFINQNEGYTPDLSNTKGVEEFQKKIGMKGKAADGKFGKDTVAALEKLNLKTEGINVSDVSTEDMLDLKDAITASGTTYQDYEKYVRKNFGDISEEDFVKDKELQGDITLQKIAGAIKQSNLHYDKNKDRLKGLTKQEFRKALIIYPDLLTSLVTEEDETSEVDLDVRVPGTTKTLGYALKGSKYKGKRYINKKDE